jgi:putative nucleotidyltransferase with HDIG domain
VEQKQLDNCRRWFDAYVAGFYGRDEFVNANLKLKEEHTRRVCQEMLYLAEELGLGSNQRRVAEAIALFHDIGRFEQFARYRTYNDGKSVNHCLLGVEILHKTTVIEALDGQEKQLIQKAVEYHGVKQLPEDLDGQCLFFSKLIRDADKLDVFYVFTEYYKQYRDDPENFMLALDVLDEPWYSPEIVEEILRARQIDSGSLQTLNDMKLCLLGWVYDVNFVATLKRIRQRRLLETLVEFLPRTRDIEKVQDKILAYVDFRIEQDE